MKRKHPLATAKRWTLTAKHSSVTPSRLPVTARHSPASAWRSRSFRLKLLANLKFFLLIPPALGWAVIFLSLAGVPALERMVASTPGAVEVFTLFGCPLLAVILGLRAVAEVGKESARGVMWCWLTTGAGVLLFVFGVLVVMNA